MSGRSRMRGSGARDTDDPGNRQRVRNYRSIAAEDELRRSESHDGIKRKPLPVDLNDTERLVLRILDEDLVTAREIAGFAGVSVEQCRRALATLRTLGMAEMERPRRKNATSLWKRS